MLQLPDHISIKTAAPFVIGAYLGVWLIATVYFIVLNSQILKLKKELNLLTNKPLKEKSLFSLIVWITIAAIVAAVVFLASGYSSASEKSIKDSMSIVIYLYIALWTLSFAFLLYIGHRLFKLYSEIQSLDKSLGSESST